MNELSDKQSGSDNGSNESDKDTQPCLVAVVIIQRAQPFYYFFFQKVFFLNFW